MSTNKEDIIKILGINGFKGVGKGETFSAVADYALIIEHDNPTVKGVGFSDRLKVLAAKSLGFDRSDEELIALMDSFKETAIIQMYYDEPPLLRNLGQQVEHDLTGREYLQFLGDNARQVFGADFWVDQVLETPTPGYRHALDAMEIVRYPGVDLLCLTDERYPNEAQRVKDLGGINWEIIKPGVVSDGHVSETPLPRELVDRVIVNDGSLEDLFDKVAAAYEEDLRC